MTMTYICFGEMKVNTFKESKTRFCKKKYHLIGKIDKICKSRILKVYEKNWHSSKMSTNSVSIIKGF